MKIVGILLLAALPASAQGMMMGRGGGDNHATMMVVVYALLGVLGYWVLQHVAKEKDAEKYVKRTGQAVAWALLGISFLGVACSLLSHAGRMSYGQMHSGQYGNIDREIYMMTDDEPGEMRRRPGKFQRGMGDDSMMDSERPPLPGTDEKPEAAIPPAPKKK